MKNKIFGWLAVLAITISSFQFNSAQAQGTAFIYQGQLSDGGAPANGTNYGMVFGLYDAVTNGTEFGSVTITNMTVSNGLFAATLDFGSAFGGNSRWLQLSVQKNGGTFTNLVPRVPIFAVPYAIMAGSASNLLGTLPAAQLSGAIANGNLPANPTFTGTVAAGGYFGTGTGLTNLNPYSLAAGGVGSALYLTNAFNTIDGNFSGYYYGNGGGLTNLNPNALSSGYVSAQLSATNILNTFNGSFAGYHYGDASGVTNVNANSITGGLTTNLIVTVPGGTATLCFTNGVLRAVR